MKTLSLSAAIVALGAVSPAWADRHWTGGGATTDWTDTANWGAGNGSGNWVFGGGQVAQLPDEPTPIIVTFTNHVSLSDGIWIENAEKPDIVWRVEEGADSDAGLSTTFTSSKWGKAINVGTGNHGGLTIEGGVYYFPSELWIGNGAVDSYFTLNGGVFTNQSYTCIGYGGYSRTATMTVNGGTFRQNSNTFIVGQGNHSGCKGVFNLMSGSVDTAANATCSENQGTSEMNISGGSFRVGGQLMLAEGKSGTATTTMDISGGTIKVVGFSRAAVGSNSSATITMSDGTFDTDNEFVLASGTGSTADMTLSGGTFTPRKLWIGSHFSHTSSGCNATFTMTGGTLATDSDQDIVVGGNANAVGTFNMQGGTVNCGKRFHIAWRGSGTLNMTGGDIYVPAGQDLCFNNDTGTSAAMQLNGGTFHTDTITMSTRDGVTQTLTVNGGSFAPVTDKADWLADVPMTVGANGIGLASGGYSATFSANLTPAAEEQPIKAVFTGADRTGVISFASSTFEQIDSFEIASNGVMVVAMGGTVEKPLKIDADGTLVVDVSGGISVNGSYDLVTLSGGLVDTTITSDNVDIVGLPGVATLAYTVENNVLKVTVSGLERLVINTDGGEWTAADTWKGETSGTVRAFTEKDRAAFVITEDNTVQTVLVNSEVAPLGVDVEVTGENSYALIKGHGTFAPAELSVKGVVGFAGDAEGPLNLDVALERTLEGDVDVSKALFADGTVNLLTSLHMDSTVNGKLVREKDWTPSYKIDGTGEVEIKNAKLTLNNPELFKNFAGTVVLGEGSQFDDANYLNGGAIFGGATLKMAGGTIERFGNDAAEENLRDVVLADGTSSIWWNQKSRGNMGAHVKINGDISGSGKLTIYQKGSNARSIKFDGCTFENLTGTIEMHGINYEFNKNNGTVKGGTFLVSSDANVLTGNITIESGVTWIMNNNDDYNLTCLSGATIGGNGNGKVNNLTLNDGVKFRFTSETALTDLSAEYVALTVANPISGPLPTLENADNERGKWKLVVREIPAETEEGSPTYQLVAEFHKKGFVISLR
ncbi:MAG: hypothetical protein E7049_04605 [Lentisphaerae bacterium]|nr:hypothetical protein [Lentisphaerota bacterium]